ncbi:hypothetical protein THRCLA_04053 [Thraustotheca clavata]|uniref:Temptin Cys/Cys disulfide domain-containing protein n=1 Tax=Thraustotheca clavata TaxID=74557 RepID=A0A1W0A044_9STRA|nr:hypothetical protein THRCLA_04053 [Thraustotheca clavata]
MKFVSLLAVLAVADCKPQYVIRVPNGGNVPSSKAIGHKSSNGGGPVNSFGNDFSANGLTWTTMLCQTDSDGDGATNGQELLDPCCVWTQGATTNAGIPTHPGEANTFTAAQLAALQCNSNTSSNTTITSTQKSNDATALQVYSIIITAVVFSLLGFT